MPVTPAPDTDQRHAARLAAKAASTKAHRLIHETAWVRQCLSPSDRIEDIAVKDMTWAGYRYMSPLARTELFHATYLRMYRRFHAEKHPDKDPTKLRPLPDDLSACGLGDLRALWKARMIADAIGVPYEFYLEKVMSSRMHVDHWRRPPRPNQLYPKHVLIMVGDAWCTADRSAYLYTDDWDARSFADANLDDAHQQAARSLLQREVEKSADPVATLADFLCIKRAITVEVARDLFGDVLVDAAIASTDQVPVSGVVTTTTTAIPNCIGYHMLDEPNGNCECCPVASECQRIDQAVRDRLQAATGDDEPWVARQRADVRERQRRSRAKMAATSAERAMRRQAEADRKEREARKARESEILGLGRALSERKRTRADVGGQVEDADQSVVNDDDAPGL